MSPSQPGVARGSQVKLRAVVTDWAPLSAGPCGLPRLCLWLGRDATFFCSVLPWLLNCPSSDLYFSCLEYFGLNIPLSYIFLSNPAVFPLIFFSSSSAGQLTDIHPSMRLSLFSF